MNNIVFCFGEITDVSGPDVKGIGLSGTGVNGGVMSFTESILSIMYAMLILVSSK